MNLDLQFWHAFAPAPLFPPFSALPVNHRTYSASSGGGYGTPSNNLAGGAAAGSATSPSPGGFMFNFPPPAVAPTPRPSLSDNNNLYPPQPIWGQPTSPGSFIRMCDPFSCS